jgi:hypothetical protein
MVLLEGHDAGLLIEKLPLPAPDQVICTLLGVQHNTQALRVAQLDNGRKACRILVCMPHTGAHTQYRDRRQADMQAQCRHRSSCANSRATNSNGPCLLLSRLAVPHLHEHAQPSDQQPRQECAAQKDPLPAKEPSLSSLDAGCSDRRWCG